MNVSVIVVSRGRPHWLARCLTALRQLDHPSFEVVLVADPDSLSKVNHTGMKAVVFHDANISAARNAGIREASGEICAFIDDDAVPEPLWLNHICVAFDQTNADAVVGYVRGRNGISYQSRVASVDAEAETHEELPGDETAHFPNLHAGHALKLVGTNMSFRRSTLSALNGFDEAFRYYLDDTDISLRLHRAGKRAAVAPLAEVHHGFAPSERRTSLRAPTDLFDIGRSSAIYFRRHKPSNTSELFKRIHRREKARLIRHMNIGTIEPRDVRGLLATLDAGWADGISMDLPTLDKNFDAPPDFNPLKSLPSGHQVLSSRLLKRRETLKNASELSRNGHRCSVFSFSLTPVRHHVRYTDSGVWIQTGGQFGRTIRDGKRFRWCRFARRREEEIQRVAKIRGI